jgi:hypothetical protein
LKLLRKVLEIMDKTEALEMSLKLWEMRPTTLGQKKAYALKVSDGKGLAGNCPLCQYTKEASDNTSLYSSCEICPVAWTEKPGCIDIEGNYCCLPGAEYSEWQLAIHNEPPAIGLIDLAIDRMIRAIKRGIEDDKN